jgi:D-aminopeptidase
MSRTGRFSPWSAAVLVGLGLALTAGRAALPAQAQSQPRALKVFISIDMEGLTGVAAGNEVSPNGPDYGHFRAVMAAEANAAIEGASRAGATEFVVRDSHGNKTNLLPGDLDPRAQLIRGASTGPKNMMEGIDETFAAAVFIGGGAISSLSPASAQRQIMEGVERAVRGRDRVKPYKLAPPYTMVLKVRTEKPLYRGAERPRPGESVLRHADLLEILNAFNAMK